MKVTGVCPHWDWTVKLSGIGGFDWDQHISTICVERLVGWLAQLVGPRPAQRDLDLRCYCHCIVHDRLVTGSIFDSDGIAEEPVSLNSAHGQRHTRLDSPFVPAA